MERMPLYKSIWKPILFMGVERLPFMIVALTSGVMLVQGTVWVKLFSVAYAAVMIAIMAYCNSRDPHFFKILWRYIRKQDFYPNNAIYPGKPDKPDFF